ncbi:succinate dehydrogenase assembly factor 2 [Rickettsia endosymbiont of Cardiosporidium cionae]|uniref:succinate dehydrogenase assembly factor 2 n=1 Tax=Rickettsia endosymbiont of Cardiosporidium cionae TaxID=2777155 RepID=UPI0018961846|nr:succinate dehydrogenase assembly factor 2 [Rickettsia endosymbiont of Cardiosporidium cionae]KAF8818728.1 succinate dehydrogenase assembly factor 2 [Rickettsia endosymbiont of Cardiosporidium cionae]
MINIQDKVLLKKKIIYKVLNRGTKETETILQNFVFQSLENMSYAELKDLDIIVSCTDMELYDWIIKKYSCPEWINEQIIEKISNLRLIKYLEIPS